MDILNGMAVFAAVVEAGSFTAAAQNLGQSKSSISKQITKLEDRLGARLLNRTTRKLKLTDVGQDYYERCRRIVEEAEEAELAVTTMQDSPRGLLKISTSHSFGSRHIAPLLPEFMKKYGDISLEIHLSGQMVDLVEQGFDLAIRVGNLRDSSLIARKLADVHFAVAASPEYWDRHGRPEHPRELSQHNCFTYAYAPSPRSWQFQDKNGRDLWVPVQGNLHGNSGDFALKAALDGLGVAALPTFFAPDAYEDGRLETVLDDFNRPPSGVYAVYPHSRHLSTKVRVFVDFLVERLKHASF
ncbi:LysR family transcriptional regulator [Aestuariispira insulae]|uniref:LysR family transcriptional regulator n=1 Tax=Aestuariispira insulae TaxID=1461337 RepID=A0A3D9HXX7_9PROT|nr:LysR family transcriptional regulator [Aestuariispira insulae]RED54221.1 LysR family transcriptional regulator [Aestuariispira insulae]